MPMAQTSEVSDELKDEEFVKDVNATQEEFDDVLRQEKYHCTGKRFMLIAINFVALFAT